MANQDSRIPLGSNAKGKNEFPHVTTRKYTSSPRIPADISWPKIPDRKLHKHVICSNNPCVVSLTGNSQKIQPPRTSFARATTRKDNTVRSNNATSNFIPQTDARDRRTHGSTTHAFKTTIKMQESCSNDVVEKNTSNSNDTNIEVINANQSEDNFSNQINQDNDVNETVDQVTNNTSLDITSECQINSESNTITEYRVIERNVQHNKETKNIKNSNGAQRNQEYTKPTIEHQWVSGKACAFETTDSEMYSSDATKSSRKQDLSKKRLKYNQKDDNDEIRDRKCINKKYEMNSRPIKTAQKKDRTVSCFCLQREKQWTPQGRHSEPQMGCSQITRRCSTGHGKRFRCCQNTIQRVASDSDCVSTCDTDYHYEKKTRKLVAYSLRKLLDCPETLKVLLTRDGKDMVKRQMMMESDNFNNRMGDSNYQFGNTINRNEDTVNLIDGPDAEGSNKSTVPREADVIEIHSNNPQGDKQPDRRLFKLKTAVFFGSLIYVLIIASPKIYDYFFYEEEEEEEEEEYDAYEDMNYFEMILDYVVCSVREACDGLFELINKTFFQSRTCKKCSGLR